VLSTLPGKKARAPHARPLPSRAATIAWSSGRERYEARNVSTL